MLVVKTGCDTKTKVKSQSALPPSKPRDIWVQVVNSPTPAPPVSPTERSQRAQRRQPRAPASATAPFRVDQQRWVTWQGKRTFGRARDTEKTADGASLARAKTEASLTAFGAI